MNRSLTTRTEACEAVVTLLNASSCPMLMDVSTCAQAGEYNVESIVQIKYSIYVI